MLGVLWLLPSACRLDNPAFREGAALLRNEENPEPKAQEESAGVETQGTGAETQGTGGTPTATLGHSGVTTEVTSSIQDNTTTREDSTSASESGTTSALPDSDRSPFCQNGAKFCYPFREASSKPSFYLDEGGSFNHLRPEGPDAAWGTTDGWPEVGEPFMRALYLQPGGKVRQVKGFAYQGGAVGFDVWYRSDSTLNTNYALIELDGVLALHQHDQNQFECVTQAGGKPFTSSMSLQGTSFRHMACILEGNNLQLIINNQAGPATSLTGLPQAQDAPAIIGNAGTLTTSADFKGRFTMIRIWTDIDAMRSTIKKELDEMCPRLKVCN